MELTRRYRVNISRSVKGVTTFDCTVELANTLGLNDASVNDAETHRDCILKESDALVAELNKRYPPGGEG
ncbi:hypothetical protein LCGC14_2873020 [marine sediment metagenome]|uniref:Uncharacterized protein n=1 Tax=marine sediment metagenome TaxID=412755 RepID=A0A0F9ATK4_9ZZZZ